MLHSPRPVKSRHRYSRYRSIQRNRLRTRDLVRSPRIGSRHDEFNYPSAEEIIELNKDMLDRFKTDRRDRHLLWYSEKLNSILMEVKSSGGDTYDKATVLIQKLTKGHVFKSGNKRTAFAATMIFLKMNDENAQVAPNPKVMQGIREGFYTHDEIKSWLKGHAIREFRRE